MIGELVGGCVAAVLMPQQAVSILASSAIVGLWKSLARRKVSVGSPKQSDVTQLPDLDKVTLAWSKLTATVQTKVGQKVLLDSVSGYATPGRILAILGPSGAGKTSLLNAIAGQIPTADAISLSGSFTSTSSRPPAYVRQKPMFFSHMTVRETLYLAATLRLPRAIPEQQKIALADALMAKLGLAKCADTIVGDAKSRGVSGGEMKRLSLATELISAPSVIFTDEPTSGLDSFSAEKVVSSLRQLADDGRTIICSVHQPRGSIFAMFDDILLLADGRVVYMGPADNVVQYFAGLGHQCPTGTNPAEFLSDLIAIDYSTDESAAESRARIDGLIDAFKTSNQAEKANQVSAAIVAPSPDTETTQDQQVGWFQQFRLLLSRAWKQVSRDKKNNKARLIPSITSAILFGTIYWKLKLTQAAAMDRMGLLQVAAINTAMLSLVKTLYVFPKERGIVDNERARNSYQVLPYFLSKLCAELPVAAIFPSIFASILYPMAGLHGGFPRFFRFLRSVVLHSFACASYGLTIGAVAPTPEAAIAFGPASMVLFIVFGGYYVGSVSVPKFLKFLPTISIIRWTFESFCINEFRGLKFETKRPWDANSGEMFLERLQFGNDNLGMCVLAQLRFLLANYVLTYIVLRLKKPSFVRIEEVSEEED